MVEVNPSLLSSQINENVELYIKLKLGIFLLYDINHVVK